MSCKQLWTETKKKKINKNRMNNFFGSLMFVMSLFEETLQALCHIIQFDWLKMNLKPVSQQIWQCNIECEQFGMERTELEYFEMKHMNQFFLANINTINIENGNIYYLILRLTFDA